MLKTRTSFWLSCYLDDTFPNNNGVIDTYHGCKPKKNFSHIIDLLYIKKQVLEGLEDTMIGKTKETKHK